MVAGNLEMYPHEVPRYFFVTWLEMFIIPPPPPSLRGTWGNANKLFKVFDSLFYFRLVMLECVHGRCPSIIGKRREIVQADGMVRFVYLF